MTIPNKITDSDMILLESVDSYIKGLNAPYFSSPQEKLMFRQQARDWLYSEDVRRMPRVAAYILTADLESDNLAQALSYSISRHMMDPAFINLLMQYLGMTNNSEENIIVGALLTKLLSKWIEQNINKPVATASATKKKDDSKEESKTEKHDISEVEHINKAIKVLLGNLAKVVNAKCPNINEGQALAIAAAVSLNSEETITEIIASDYPVTADIFEIYRSDRNAMSSIIIAALRLEQTSIPGKPSTNQQAFLDSLKRWIYGVLNEINPQESYQILIAAYGTTTAKVDTKFINPKDCGNQFMNLREVAKMVINK